MWSETILCPKPASNCYGNVDPFGTLITDRERNFYGVGGAEGGEGAGVVFELIKSP